MNPFDKAKNRLLEAARKYGRLKLEMEHAEREFYEAAHAMEIAPWTGEMTAPAPPQDGGT